MQRKEESKGNSFSGSGTESQSDENDADFLDDSSMYEKKLNILHIPHILIWKVMNTN